MLREWTATGYLTRAYVNFALPYVVEGKPTSMRSETDNVISVEFGGNQKPLPTPADPTAAPPALTAPPGVADGPGSPEPPPDTAVSLNTATFRDVAAVKGISKKVAENIVAARPFTSLDELLNVKGVGAKLLKKVRQLIKL